MVLEVALATKQGESMEVVTQVDWKLEVSSTRSSQEGGNQVVLAPAEPTQVEGNRVVLGLQGMLDEGKASKEAVPMFDQYHPHLGSSYLGVTTPGQPTNLPTMLCLVRSEQHPQKLVAPLL